MNKNVTIGREYEITLKTLELLKSFIPEIDENDHSVAAEDYRENIKAFERVTRFLKREMEYQELQEMHSQITIAMEIGDEKTEALLSEEIPLKEWAKKHGLDESYARKKARRGSLKTAHKIGRDWFISKNEPNLDGRKKK